MAEGLIIKGQLTRERLTHLFYIIIIWHRKWRHTNWENTDDSSMKKLAVVETYD